MPPALTVFFDEAGDPGIRDGVRYAPQRHEWLCLSAVVVRTVNEPDTVAWIREMREVANARQSETLHYHRIAKARREGVCSTMGEKPLRVFCLASHKTNMREHINPRLGKMDSGHEFYNWCTRILFERLTDWCAAVQKREMGQLEPLRLVLAERGGHDYQSMFDYVDKLKWQSSTNSLKIKGIGLDPPLLEREHWSVERAEARAGLQLADTAASAFYQAANTISPSWDIAPAKTLKPVVAKNTRGDQANYGLTVWPLRHQSPLPAASRPIFEFFGYQF